MKKVMDEVTIPPNTGIRIIKYKGKPRDSIKLRSSNKNLICSRRKWNRIAPPPANSPRRIESRIWDMYLKISDSK
jgi:hypothetical protein